MNASALVSEKRLLAFGFIVMFWSSPGQTYLISLFGAELRAAFDLNHGRFGALYSLATLASAVLMVWSGRLVDRVDLARLTLVLTLVLTAACALMALSGGAASLLVAFFILRHVGQGLLSHLAMTTMSRYFEGARGRATAVASLGFVVAEALLPSAVIAATVVFGWRATWSLLGLAALVCLLPARGWLLRGHRERHRRHLSALADGSDRLAAPAMDPRRGAARPAFLSGATGNAGAVDLFYRLFFPPGASGGR